jgi:hypothetical protein
MNVFYAIMSCNGYLNSRCQWQKDTWLKHVQNWTFIGPQMRPSHNMVGYNTADDYNSCPIKILKFIQNYDVPAHIDWVAFVDDDTFIFPQRLHQVLATYDASQNLYIGSLLNNDWHYMSGGAGFVVSRALYNLLRGYVNSHSNEELLVTSWSDKTFGRWVSNFDVKFIHNERFKLDYAKEYALECISCHYVTKEGFTFLNSHM